MKAKASENLTSAAEAAANIEARGEQTKEYEALAERAAALDLEFWVLFDQITGE